MAKKETTLKPLSSGPVALSEKEPLLLG